MNGDRIASILKDEDFKELVSRMKADLTGRVMAKATDDEARATALAQFHALDTLVARMGTEAQNSKVKE